MLDRNRKALLIGIDDYPCPNALKYCVNDCNALEELLRENDDADNSPNFDITRIDNCPNVAIANAAIKKLFEDDNVGTALFYFAGHGFIDANGQGEIVFPDNSTDRTTIYHGIRMDDIMKIVSKSTIKNKILILDCCHSGKIANDVNNEAWLPNGCAILASCRTDQNSIASSSVAHGIFTEMLIQALNGEASDFLGDITIGSIYAYVDRCLWAFEQRPIFKSNISSFISIRNVMPPLPIRRMKEGLRLFKDVNDDFKLTPKHEFSTYEEPEKAKDYDECKTFGLLQDLQRIGFVEPVGEKFMYYAAINSKSCHLTTTGKNYWNLLKKNKI